MGAAAKDEVGCGVLAREIGRLLPSPNLVKDSMVLSMLPFRPRRIVALRRSSGNPISFKAANFASNDGVPESSVDAPIPCVTVFKGSGGGGEAFLLGEFALLRENRRRLDVDEAERSPIPKNLPVFGGRGGGEPSGDLVYPES